MSSIVGKVIGGGGSTAKTYILKTEDGQEIPAVLTEDTVNLTATANDIRLGTVAVTNDGVIEGTKVIPAYHTFEGFRVVTAGSTVTIPNFNTIVDIYDYTKLQTMLCAFNTNVDNSVSVEKVSIGDSVYNVQSVDAISSVTKNHDTKTINLGITNETGKPMILRYFTYKEVN